jgi:diketogulonate reductase-like aldo/keto reductase
MFTYWKSHRSLNNRIVEIDKESAGRMKSDNVDLLALAIASDRYERQHLEMELKVLESERLREIASRYGISSFPNQEMYDPRMKDV